LLSAEEKAETAAPVKTARKRIPAKLHV